MTLSPKEFETAMEFAAEVENEIQKQSNHILKILNADVFAYLNIQATNSISGLSSHVAGPDWIRDGLPLAIPPNNGFYFLSKFPDNVSNKILANWKEKHSLDNLLYYFIHHKYHTEIFAFAAEKSKKRITTSYLNNTANMVNFIAQFKKDANSLINIINKNHRWIYSNALLLKPNYVDKQITTIIDIRKFKLNKFEDDLCGLSKNEFQCLVDASNQQTAKNTAATLNIDLHTAEHYLNSCKAKLNCSTTREMMHYFRVIMRH